MNDRKVQRPFLDRADSASELSGSLERLHQRVRPRIVVVLQEHRLSVAATRANLGYVLP